MAVNADGSHRIEFANGLRGIAAIAVVLAHYYGVYWYGRVDIAKFTGMAPLPASIPIPPGVVAFNTGIAPIVAGPFGVALFFLISGFVIPFSFNRKTCKQFLIGRFFRIWPTYFCGFLLSIGIVATVLAAEHRPIPFGLHHILTHAVLGLREIRGFPTMDGVIWTLETEMRFYVVAAILGPTILARGRPIAYLAPALLCAFTLIIIPLNAHFHTPDGLAWARHEGYYFPYVIYMFVGVSLNFHYRGFQTLPVTAISIIGLLVAADLSLGLTPVPAFAGYLAPSYLLALAVFAVSSAVPQAVWGARPFRFMAGISYPLYVVHALTGFTLLNVLVMSFAVDPNIAVVAAFVVAIVLAWLLHVLVEMPTQKFGNRLAARAAPDNPAESPIAPLSLRV